MIDGVPPAWHCWVRGDAAQKERARVWGKASVPPVNVPDSPGTSQAQDLPRLLLFAPFSFCSTLEKKQTLYVYLMGGKGGDGGGIGVDVGS